MIQVQVSIGRNTSPGISLNDITWYNFQRAVSDSLWLNTRGGGRWIEVHKGEGVWEDQREESAHVTVLDVFDIPSRWALTRDLAAIAERYGQSAVALAVTEPELIAAA